jgi:hypothetical protein
MKQSPGRAARLRQLAESDRALLDSVQVIADVAHRVALNGPDVAYASEKLGHVLYKAAEGLALCDVELEEVVSEAHRGYRHGLCLKEEWR